MSSKKNTIAITNRFLAEMDRILYEQDMTIEEFGSIVGILSSNISRMRRGDGYVTLEAIAILCKKFEVSEAKIISGKEESLSQDQILLKLQNIESLIKKFMTTSRQKSADRV